jgi:hypothetical protein
LCISKNTIAVRVFPFALGDPFRKKPANPSGPLFAAFWGFFPPASGNFSRTHKFGIILAFWDTEG